MLELEREVDRGAKHAQAHERTRHLVDLVLHLARRQLDAAHRLTFLGWLWPLARQLAQLVVLVFLFSRVIDLEIDDFPAFVFTGLIVWTWFSSGLTEATRSLVQQRHLVFTPKFRDVALPLVAVAAPVVDLLMALPLLLVMLGVEGRLSATALLFPVLLASLFLFTAGVGMLTSAVNVYYRDVGDFVSIGLLLLFYLTPVFYSMDNAPENARWVLELNPVGIYVDAARALLFDGDLPSGWQIAALAGLSTLVPVAGYRVFRRLQPRFVDEL